MDSYGDSHVMSIFWRLFSALKTQRFLDKRASRKTQSMVHTSDKMKQLHHGDVVGF
jgi:hypothetical protein